MDEESQSPSQSQSLLTGGDDDEELEEVQEGGSGEDGGEEEEESADEAEDEEIADEQPLITGKRKRTFPMRYNVSLYIINSFSSFNLLLFSFQKNCVCGFIYGKTSKKSRFSTYSRIKLLLKIVDFLTFFVLKGMRK